MLLLVILLCLRIALHFFPCEFCIIIIFNVYQVKWKKTMLVGQWNLSIFFNFNIYCVVVIGIISFMTLSLPMASSRSCKTWVFGYKEDLWLHFKLCFGRLLIWSLLMKSGNNKYCFLYVLIRLINLQDFDSGIERNFYWFTLEKFKSI